MKNKNNKSKLFLTEVDQHHPKPLVGKQLRSYVMLHALFNDRLLIGDSQFNNNPHIRRLLWDKEPQNKDNDGVSNDLAVLLEEGYLLPTIRKDYDSLENLRIEHQSRRVDNVPSEEFVSFAQEKIGKRKETYDIQSVSKVFHQRCLNDFSSPENRGRGKLSRENLARVFKYIQNQDILLYKSLRDWAIQEIEAGNFTQRDYQLIDRIVAGAYRHNVPFALDINIDVPIPESRDPFPIAFQFGDKPTFHFRETEKIYSEWILPPAFHLSNSFLSKIPSEALLYIKGSKEKSISPLSSYTEITRYVERFRSGDEVKLDTFQEEMALFLTETEIIVREFLNKKNKNIYLKKKDKDIREAILSFTRDTAIEAIGIAPIVGSIASMFGIYFVASGGLKQIRAAVRQDDYIRGYLSGKSAIAESLLLNPPKTFDHEE